MQTNGKRFIIGGSSLILGFLLIAPGLSDYSTAAARGIEAPWSTTIFLISGGLFILVGLGLLIRGFILKHRYQNTVQTWDSREPEATNARPAVFGDRPTWMDRPANHMGDNYGQKRE